ncbi:MAG: diaminopimelate epimerase [Tenericutes bacterium HGW-Tenericutes-2]|jgi:diaminopimelate epimerase|nr:MAG: diaminopimelate epimerase [Tenericutes bacterium HGW-Tenericutes-2]
MKFQKYHGTGNDFIMVSFIPSNPEELAKNICDRHFGIGADGLIYPSESSVADIKFNYYNSDGSIAPMCGNGMRCFVQYLLDNQMINKHSFNVETLAGIIHVEYNPESKLIKINLGKPIFKLEEPNVSTPIHEFKQQALSISGNIIKFYTINMGTLHTVLYVTPNMDIKSIGPELSKNKFFPKHSNVNFVEVIDQNTQKITTFERGAGWTLSCGTGTAASAVVSRKLGLVNEVVQSIVPGGVLNVYVEEEIKLEGPAKRIATGEYE